MNKITFILLSCSILFACQPKHEGYTIHGNIAGNSEGAKVKLLNIQNYPPLVVDSTTIVNGKFLFKGKVELPDMYQLLIDLDGQEKNMLSSLFYLENSDITYTGHIDSLQTYYWSEDNYRKEPIINGSQSQDLYNAYRHSTEKLTKKYRELDNQYLKVYHRPALDGIFNTQEGITLIKQINEIGKEKNAIRWKFIEQHPGTIIGYNLASQYLDGMSVNLTVPQIDQLISIITPAWNKYPEKVTAFKEKAEKAKKMALGVKYQDIELMNPAGEIVKLSEYVPQDKYVMLEFWASWCGPCRGEIPHLRHVYNNYKDKGFEIISISIDQKKADWDKATKEENMVWKQLCDPKGFEGPVAEKYNISGVPTCILLDKEGRIFKTEMRGAALDAELEELYGPINQ